jgi:hypothetical protein
MKELRLKQKTLSEMNKFEGQLDVLDKKRKDFEAHMVNIGLATLLQSYSMICK